MVLQVKPTRVVRGQLSEILSLRHDAFVAEGEITPMPDGRLTDEFDDLPNASNYGLMSLETWTFVAAIRLHLLREYQDNSPARRAFSDVIGSLLPWERGLPGKIVLDCNRLVTSPEMRGFNKLDLYNKITRCGFMAMEHFGVDLATMTVRAEHRSFYAREMMAQELAPLRAYPMLKSPICLMALDVPRHLGAILDKNERWRSTEAERAELFR